MYAVNIKNDPTFFKNSRKISEISVKRSPQTGNLSIALCFFLFVSRINKTAIVRLVRKKRQKLSPTIGFEGFRLQCRQCFFLKRQRISAVHRSVLLLNINDFIG